MPMYTGDKMHLQEQQEIELIYAFRRMHPEDKSMQLVHAKSRAAAYANERPQLHLVSSITPDPASSSTMFGGTAGKV